MGTRVELHRFGAGDADALFAARRAIEAVDDALTIHRPSPTTALNDELMAGRPSRVTDPLLFDALVEIVDSYPVTLGLFDPAADHAMHSGWSAIRFDRDNARIEASSPVALDFGGFGKGFALDRACAALKQVGVTSAFLSAGESSIAVIGEHPLGGGWPVAVPHPDEPEAYLVEIELIDQALSISSTVGAGTAAPGRAATIRPLEGTAISAPRTAVAVETSGALAEMISTALIVADAGEVRRLVAGHADRRYLFDHAAAARAAHTSVRMLTQ